MHRPVSRRPLAAIIASLYFLVNGVFAHAVESNMWAERRDAARRMKGGDAASGPAGESSHTSDKYQLLAQLPQAAQVSPFSTVDLFTASNARRPGDARSAAPSVPSWVSSLVLPYGSIQSVHLSKDPDAPLVVHVQDAHEIEEAQRNTASMIEGLSGRAGVALVGLEGAEGAFDFNPYRIWPDQEVTKQITGYFLKNGYIGGTEYAAITLPKPPLVWGLEALDIYLANIKATQDAVKFKPAVDKRLQGLEARTEPLKAKIYSEDLKTFDKHYRAYKEQREGLGEYVSAMFSLSKIVPSPWMGEGQGGGENSFPNLALLLKALTLEKSLDFKRVEKERMQLVEVLVRKLPKPDLDALVQKSLDYRTGRLGYGEFHQSLKDLCRSHGVSLSSFEQFNAYVDYVLLADRIDRNSLLSELDGMEEAVPAALAKTEDQKILVTSVRHLAVLKKLTNHQMTPMDWAYYAAHQANIIHVSESLNSISPKAGPPSPSEGEDWSESLKPFEDFCRLALQRNQALVGNLLDKMRKENAKTAFLVAGGFHTDGMTELLREKGASYIVVTPKITEIPKENHSLDIFTRDPIPLERLFAGEKIYLVSPRPTNPEVVAKGGPTVIAREHVLKELDRAFEGLAGKVRDAKAEKDGTFVYEGKTETGERLFHVTAIPPNGVAPEELRNKEPVTTLPIDIGGQKYMFRLDPVHTAVTDLKDLIAKFEEGVKKLEARFTGTPSAAEEAAPATLRSGEAAPAREVLASPAARPAARPATAASETGRFVTSQDVAKEYQAVLDALPSEIRRMKDAGEKDLVAAVNRWLSDKVDEGKIPVLFDGSPFVPNTPLMASLDEALKALEEPGAPARDKGAVVRGLFKGVVFDHHGFFYEEERDQDNSTIYFIRHIREVMAGDPAQGLDKLKRRFARVSTDNLGDAMLAVWIARNLDWLVREPAFLSKMERVAWIEDFGIFGSKTSYEGIPGTESEWKAAWRVDRAILQIYDNVLADNKLSGADRFANPSNPGKEREIVETVLSQMGEILDSADITPIKLPALAKQFQDNVDKLKAHYEGAVVEADLGNLTGQIVVLDGAKVPVEINGRPRGVFSNWSAGTQVRPEAPIQLLVSPGQPGRNAVIISYRTGHLGEVFGREEGLTGLRDAINDKEDAWQREQHITGPPAKLGGRKGLQFNFAGLLMGIGAIVETIKSYGEKFPEVAAEKHPVSSAALSSSSMQKLEGWAVRFFIRPVIRLFFAPIFEFFTDLAAIGLSAFFGENRWSKARVERFLAKHAFEADPNVRKLQEQRRRAGINWIIWTGRVGLVLGAALMPNLLHATTAGGVALSVVGGMLAGFAAGNIFGGHALYNAVDLIKGWGAPLTIEGKGEKIATLQELLTEVDKAANDKKTVAFQSWNHPDGFRVIYDRIHPSLKDIVGQAALRAHELDKKNPMKPPENSERFLQVLKTALEEEIAKGIVARPAPDLSPEQRKARHVADILIGKNVPPGDITPFLNNIYTHSNKAIEETLFANNVIGHREQNIVLSAAWERMLELETLRQGIAQAAKEGRTVSLQEAADKLHLEPLKGALSELASLPAVQDEDINRVSSAYGLNDAEQVALALVVHPGQGAGPATPSQNLRGIRGPVGTDSLYELAARLAGRGITRRQWETIISAFTWMNGVGHYDARYTAHADNWVSKFDFSDTQDALKDGDMDDLRPAVLAVYYDETGNMRPFDEAQRIGELVVELLPKSQPLPIDFRNRGYMAGDLMQIHDRFQKGDLALYAEGLGKRADLNETEKTALVFIADMKSAFEEALGREDLKGLKDVMRRLAGFNYPDQKEWGGRHERLQKNAAYTFYGNGKADSGFERVQTHSDVDWTKVREGIFNKKISLAERRAEIPSTPSYRKTGFQGIPEADAPRPEGVVPGPALDLPLRTLFLGEIPMPRGGTAETVADVLRSMDREEISAFLDRFESLRVSLKAGSNKQHMSDRELRDYFFEFHGDISVKEAVVAGVVASVSKDVQGSSERTDERMRALAAYLLGRLAPEERARYAAMIGRYTRDPAWYAQVMQDLNAPITPSSPATITMGLAALSTQKWSLTSAPLFETVLTVVGMATISGLLQHIIPNGLFGFVPHLQGLLQSLPWDASGLTPFLSYLAVLAQAYVLVNLLFGLSHPGSFKEKMSKAWLGARYLHSGLLWEGVLAVMVVTMPWGPNTAFLGLFIFSTFLAFEHEGVGIGQALALHEAYNKVYWGKPLNQFDLEALRPLARSRLKKADGAVRDRLEKLDKILQELGGWLDIRLTATSPFRARDARYTLARIDAEIDGRLESFNQLYTISDRALLSQDLGITSPATIGGPGAALIRGKQQEEMRMTEAEELIGTEFQRTVGTLAPGSATEISKGSFKILTEKGTFVLTREAASEGDALIAAQAIHEKLGPDSPFVLNDSGGLVTVMGDNRYTVQKFTGPSNGSPLTATGNNWRQVVKAKVELDKMMGLPSAPERKPPWAGPLAYRHGQALTDFYWGLREKGRKRIPLTEPEVLFVQTMIGPESVEAQVAAKGEDAGKVYHYFKINWEQKDWAPFYQRQLDLLVKGLPEDQYLSLPTQVVLGDLRFQGIYFGAHERPGTRYHDAFGTNGYAPRIEGFMRMFINDAAEPFSYGRLVEAVAYYNSLYPENPLSPEELRAIPEVLRGGWLYLLFKFFRGGEDDEYYGTYNMEKDPELFAYVKTQVGKWNGIGLAFKDAGSTDTFIQDVRRRASEMGAVSPAGASAAPAAVWRGEPPHQKARTTPRLYPSRVPVKDESVPWDKPLPSYNPPDFTMQSVPNQQSRPEGPFTSHEGPVAIDKDGRPLNPRGRTGLRGRGFFWKWGANPADDTVITRINPETGVLEFLAIQRDDNGQWAIPGKMREESKDPLQTLSDQLFAKTGVRLDLSHVEMEKPMGYVDDPRNTDNAWVETTARWVHLKSAQNIQPRAGDNAAAYGWIPVRDNLDTLYASHGKILEEVLHRADAKKELKPKLASILDDSPDPSRRAKDIKRAADLKRNLNVTPFKEGEGGKEKGYQYEEYVKNLQPDQKREFDAAFFHDFIRAAQRYEKSMSWHAHNGRSDFMRPQEKLLQALERNGFYESAFFADLIRRYVVQDRHGRGIPLDQPVLLKHLGSKEEKNSPFGLIKDVCRVTTEKYLEGKLKVPGLSPFAARRYLWLALAERWEAWLEVPVAMAMMGAIKAALIALLGEKAEHVIPFFEHWYVEAAVITIVVLVFLRPIKFMSRVVESHQAKIYSDPLNRFVLGINLPMERQNRRTFQNNFKTVREALAKQEPAGFLRRLSRRWALREIETATLKNTRGLSSYTRVALAGATLARSGLAVDTTAVAAAMLTELAGQDPALFVSLVKRWGRRRAFFDKFFGTDPPYTGLLNAAAMVRMQEMSHFLEDKARMEVGNRPGSSTRAESEKKLAVEAKKREMLSSLDRKLAVDREFLQDFLEKLKSDGWLKLGPDGSLKYIQGHGTPSSGPGEHVVKLDKSRRREIILSYFMAGGMRRLEYVAGRKNRKQLLSPTYVERLISDAEQWIPALESLRGDPESGFSSEEITGMTSQIQKALEDAKPALEKRLLTQAAARPQTEKPVAHPPHLRARTERPVTYPERFPVSEAQSDRAVAYPGYQPVFYEDSKLDTAPWADPKDVKAIEHPIKSFEGPLDFDDQGRPLNPRGRTGIIGRGKLGKWGPNFAADAVLTRRTPEGGLQVLAIHRKEKTQGGEAGAWAFPGGMVDPGEDGVSTARRELKEETGVELDLSDAAEVYRGYVDDPRNTDNAWMETTGVHKHLPWETARYISPAAADDAEPGSARWVDVEEFLKTPYASHGDILRRAMERGQSTAASREAVTLSSRLIERAFRWLPKFIRVPVVAPLLEAVVLVPIALARPFFPQWAARMTDRFIRAHDNKDPTEILIRRAGVTWITAMTWLGLVIGVLAPLLGFPLPEFFLKPEGVLGLLAVHAQAAALGAVVGNILSHMGHNLGFYKGGYLVVEGLGVEDKTPKTIEDLVKLFGTKEAIDANLNRDIIQALAKRWDADLAEVERRIRNAQSMQEILQATLQANRAVLKQFEQANPGKEEGKLLNKLARETHQSWLGGEKKRANYVAYTQELHDLLLEQVQAGAVYVEGADGSRKPLTAGEFENPKKKFKLKAANFKFESREKEEAFLAKFKQVTGKELKDALVNTVAGEWDELGKVEARTNKAEWGEKRAVFLYGLQADSVGAIVGTMNDEGLINRLSKGSREEKLQALVEILRRINVGWRLNNPWGGFDDRLINKPFDLEENGGIGIEDILRDALVLKAVLGVFKSDLPSVNVAGDVKDALRAAFDNGLEDVLGDMVDRQKLTDAVRANRVPEDFTLKTSNQLPQGLQDLVKLFGTQAAITANLNHDVVLVLAKQWDVDVEEVKRRMQNGAAILEALVATWQSNQAVLKQFEQANPGKEEGKLLNRLARETHQSWLGGEKKRENYVAYTQGLHDLLLDQVKAGHVFVDGADGQPKAMTAVDFENPKKKFKLKGANFKFEDKEKEEAFLAKFKQVTGKELKDALVNTVAGEWDELGKIEARTNKAEWGEKRAAFLYGLQADSVGAIIASLQNEALLSKLGRGTGEEKLQALVEILRRINVGWRLNNPWGGFTDRLIHLPFDLEENGGIGIEDILRDALVLKAVLGVLKAELSTINIPDGVKKDIQAAFDNGLETVLGRMVDRQNLAEAVRTNRVEEDFTMAAVARENIERLQRDAGPDNSELQSALQGLTQQLLKDKRQATQVLQDLHALRHRPQLFAMRSMNNGVVPVNLIAPSGRETLHLTAADGRIMPEFVGATNIAFRVYAADGTPTHERLLLPKGASYMLNADGSLQITVADEERYAATSERLTHFDSMPLRYGTRAVAHRYIADDTGRTVAMLEDYPQGTETMAVLMKDGTHRLSEPDARHLVDVYVNGVGDINEAEGRKLGALLELGPDNFILSENGQLIQPYADVALGYNSPRERRDYGFFSGGYGSAANWILGDIVPLTRVELERVWRGFSRDGKQSLTPEQKRLRDLFIQSLAAKLESMPADHPAYKGLKEELDYITGLSGPIQKAPTAEERELAEATARIRVNIEGRPTGPVLKPYNEINLTMERIREDALALQASAEARRRAVQDAFRETGTGENAFGSLAQLHAEGKNNNLLAARARSDFNLKPDATAREVREAEVRLLSLVTFETAGHLAKENAGQKAVEKGAAGYNDVMAAKDRFDLDKADVAMGDAVARLGRGGAVAFEATAAMRTDGAVLTGQEETALAEFRRLMEALSGEGAPAGPVVVALRNFEGDVKPGNGGIRNALKALADRAKGDMDDKAVARALSRMTPTLLGKGQMVSIAKNGKGEVVIAVPGLGRPLTARGLDVFALDAANWDVDKHLGDLVRFLVMLAGNLVKDASKSIGADLQSLSLIHLQA